MSKDINDTFSIKYGFNPPKLLQLDEIDKETRAALCNEIWMWSLNINRKNYWSKIQTVDVIYWMKMVA